MAKLIFVSGGVISGIGKGITTASIAHLLKNRGFVVSAIKFENYLNIDAGTINPIEHGDVFLCADGTEADMDLGSYERFLDQEVGRANFITMGRIYDTVIKRERAFGYDGEDVEAIPHVCEEIISRIDYLAKKNKIEILVIEWGGTAGEYQNVLYYEAMRLLKLRYPSDTVHVHVTYVPIPVHLGEPKTKPTQMSVKQLNSMGVHPDILITRSEDLLDNRRKSRLALFCNLRTDAVYDSPNVDIIYDVPQVYANQKLDLHLLRLINLKTKKRLSLPFKTLVKQIKTPKTKGVQIAIVGKYFQTGRYHIADAYAALIEALHHAAWKNQLNLDLDWIVSEDLEKNGVTNLQAYQGIVVPIGWGKRGAEGKILAAQYARENLVPYIGLCYGMQLAVVEYARNMAGLTGANTVENQPNTDWPVIHLMPKQVKYMKKRAYGGTMRLGNWECLIKKGTYAYEIYDKYGQLQAFNAEYGLVVERHRHRYEFNDQFADKLTQAGLILSARSRSEGLVEMIELPREQHPFYLATQGHPEYKSKPLNPHPLFLEFLAQSAKTKPKA